MQNPESENISNYPHELKENLCATSKKHTHMNNVLLIKLRHIKEACKVWKHGQAIQEEYKETIQHCRDGARKAKTHLD